MNLKDIINNSFKKISPFWPLKNLIAVNPLQGFENMPIEEAISLADKYFVIDNLPKELVEINQITIKWLQAYFDENQATFAMPFREHGLFNAWRKLAVHDKKLHKNKTTSISFLKEIAIDTAYDDPTNFIEMCLRKLCVSDTDAETFITLMLTTLAGWGSYIKYCTDWANCSNESINNISKEEYVAFRLAITLLIWPEAQQIIFWHKNNLLKLDNKDIITDLEKNEQNYRENLLAKIKSQSVVPSHTPSAQLIFCIDVRSEPFRRSIECVGDYQTYGYAGFFGIPVEIKNAIFNESYSSCPVLLTPKHEVSEIPLDQHNFKYAVLRYKIFRAVKKFYQSLKYNFTTPFALVESLGIVGGIFMFLRNFMPQTLNKCKNITHDVINKAIHCEPFIDNISEPEQVTYAFNLLKMIGLTKNFAKIVILCGHGSSTTNNAYATALDCGACGGRHGANNAKILAKILNSKVVQKALQEKNIFIPKDTFFVAAEHNTTTDEVQIFNSNNSCLDQIIIDLKKAKKINNIERIKLLDGVGKAKAEKAIQKRSCDWSQVRPEWGLARNAAFIVAPRSLTKDLNLEGRCFLHSYDFNEDPTGEFLTTILTAPMIVAQWINAQYLFSTLNNVAFGAGSKITKNITGKIGVMQGNASDLMTGLPLQSVYKDDVNAYHELQRLMTLVYASPEIITKIIDSQQILQKLFSNGWVQLKALDPGSHKIYILGRDLAWSELKFM